MKHCYAVLGYGGNGITLSMMAAQILRGHICGDGDADAESVFVHAAVLDSWALHCCSVNTTYGTPAAGLPMLNAPTCWPAAGISTRRRCETAGAVPSRWTKDSLKAMLDYKDGRRMPTGHPTR